MKTLGFILVGAMVIGVVLIAIDDTETRKRISKEIKLLLDQEPTLRGRW